MEELHGPDERLFGWMVVRGSVTDKGGAGREKEEEMGC